MHESEILCFAQRILNPFRGAMHTLKMKWADAVTTDGRNWTLYVRGERFYDDLDDADVDNISVPDIKFGTWSERQGFERAPIRLPTFDHLVRQEGEKLLQAVIEAAPSLPFDYQDHHELWLLHRHSGRPLALIASRCGHQPEEQPPLLRWTPGLAAMAHDTGFERLRDRVAALAGKQPRVAWFDNRRNTLPEGGLDQNVLTDAESELQRLRHWLAPCQLLLAMDDRARAQVERLARKHALRLAELLALYPKVIERQEITAALVEARMRRANPDDDGEVRDSNISPAYLEI